jgi:hypothetical protein
MKTPRLLAIALLALSLDLAAANLSAAQTPADLAPRVAHEIFGAVGLGELIREGALKNGESLAAFEKVRPGWKALFLQAMDEAVTRDQPAMEAVMARAFAKDFSTEELTAALTVFSDPQARMGIAAAARHMPPPVGAAACSAACMRAMGSPAGRSFMGKFSTVFGPEAQGEMVAVVVPDLFIIFGQKAKADEAKRAAP